MSNVMGSAAKAKIGAAYINCQEAVPIRTLLCELGHPQPATPTQLDNYTADGFSNNTIKQKRPKAIDMRFLLDTRMHKPRSVPHLLAARHH